MVDVQSFILGQQFQLYTLMEFGVHFSAYIVRILRLSSDTGGVSHTPQEIE